VGPRKQGPRWGEAPRPRETTQAFYDGAYRTYIDKTCWAHQRLRAIDIEAVERYRRVGCHANPVAVKVKPKSRVAAWTQDQMAAMLDAADGDTQVFLRVATASGMRLGELSGLHWSDIDVQTGIVSVARQYTAGAFSELKTSNTRRRIPLPQEVLRELKLWKLHCPYTNRDSYARTRTARRSIPRTSIVAFGIHC
jgi:integrase